MPPSLHREHPAHPRAMQPSRPAATRMAPARRPDQYWTRGRYRAYVLFGATGFVFLLQGLLVLRAVWALGSGPAAWQTLMSSLAHPLYLAWHLLALVALTWFALRFYGLFGKTQPPRIGPLRPPPPAFFRPALTAAFLAASALVIVVLWGVFP